MTNLQQARERRDGALAPATLKNVWLWLPIAIGGALSALLLLALVFPVALEMGQVLARLKVLEDYRQQIDLLKLQALQTLKEQKQAQRQQEQVLRLVTGRGDLATFLATLDLEASQTGVNLQLYEPVPAAPVGATPGAPAKPGAPPPPPAPPSPPPAPGQPPNATAAKPPLDVMAKEGLRERVLLLNASGTYPQVLAFLRRMELLDVLVEQKDLNLIAEGSEAGKNTASDTELPPQVPQVEVKLSLTLWSKEPKGPRPQPPPTPGTPSAPPG